MAVSFLRFAVRETPRMLLLERLGIQVTTFTTKAPGPQKKKVNGAGPEELSHGVSDIQATDMTAKERANLLSKKTLLHFPGKNPDPTQMPLTKSWQREIVGSGAPEHSEQTVVAHQSSAAEVTVGEKSAAAEESDSSSDSSSDSDEETVTGDALKSPVKFLRHDSPAKDDEWTKQRKQVEQGAWASKPQTELGIPVSSSSVRESPTQQSTGVEEQEAQVVHPKARGQRKHTEAAVTPPDTKTMNHEGTSGNSQRAGVLLAQSETLKEHQLEEEVTADLGASPSANAADTSLEPVAEPFEEVSDPSTYKNTQHHDYTPLTFIDLDVEMARYRLPQPSSGRLTPRH